MKTKHTIEVEVEWDATERPAGYPHRMVFQSGEAGLYSTDWLANIGITRPKQQPTPGVWHKIDDPAIEMPAAQKRVLVRGGRSVVDLTDFTRRAADRTEFMVIPE